MSGERHLHLIPPTPRRRPGLVDVIRTLGTVLVGVTATATIGIAIIGVAAIRPTSSVVDQLTRAWARVILGAAGVRIETHGVHKIDPEQAYVIISNHRSAADVMCLFVVLPLPVRFLAKQELFSIPLFGSILRSLRMVPVDRGAADHTSINAASGAALRQGSSLVVFAEGTRVTSADARPFKKGGVIIAQQHNAPILPVTMVGTGNIFAPHGRIIRNGTVAVIIADPIPPALEVSMSIDELVSTTRTIVLDNEQHWESQRRT